VQSRFKLLSRTIRALPALDRTILGKALFEAGITKNRYANPVCVADRRVRFSRVTPRELSAAFERYNSDPFALRKLELRGDSVIVSMPGEAPLTITPAAPECLFRGELPARGWFNRTLAPLEKFLEDNPGHPGALYMKGQILFRQGNLDGAEEIFGSLLDRGFRKAKKPLSEILAARGKFMDALNIYPGNHSAADRMLDSAGKSGDEDALIDALKTVSGLGRLNYAAFRLSELEENGGARAAKARNALYDIYMEAAEDSRFSEDFEAAEYFYSLAVKLGDPFKVEEKRAVLLFETGRYQEAYDLMRSLSEKIYLHPSSARVFGEVCLMLRRSPKEAIHWFNVAFNGDPAEREALLGKGRALIRLGELKAAVACFELIREHVPEADRLFAKYFAIADLMGSGDNLSGKDLSHLELDELRELSASLKKEGLFNSLTVCCDMILRIDPEDLEAMRSLSTHYMVNREFKPLESVLRKILSKDPSDNESFERLVFLLANGGKRSEAEKLVAEEIHLRPTARVFRVAGILRERNGDNAAAEKLYKESLELNPGDFRARIRLIKALTRRATEESLNEALALSLKGQEVDPERPDFFEREAAVYTAKKMYEAALEVMLDLHSRMSGKRGSRFYDRQKMFWLELRIAELYMDLKNADECRRWLDSALNLGVIAGAEAQDMIQFMQSWVRDVIEYGR